MKTHLAPEFIFNSAKQSKALFDQDTNFSRILAINYVILTLENDLQ